MRPAAMVGSEEERQVPARPQGTEDKGAAKGPEAGLEAGQSEPSPAELFGQSDGEEDQNEVPGVGRNKSGPDGGRCRRPTEHQEDPGEDEQRRHHQNADVPGPADAPEPARRPEFAKTRTSAHDDRHHHRGKGRSHPLLQHEPGHHVVG